MSSGRYLEFRYKNISLRLKVKERNSVVSRSQRLTYAYFINYFTVRFPRITYISLLITITEKNRKNCNFIIIKAIQQLTKKRKIINLQVKYPSLPGPFSSIISILTFSVSLPTNFMPWASSWPTYSGFTSYLRLV